MKSPLFCFVLITSCLFLYSQPLPIVVKAHYAILIDADTGKILYSKRASEPCYPASLTKVVTLLTFLAHWDEKNLDAKWICDPLGFKTMTAEAKKQANYAVESYLLEPDATVVGLRPHQKVEIATLLYGLAMRSATDASNQLALIVGRGSIEDFVEKMNLHVKSLGCHNTHFDNPGGLYFPTQMTTVFDLAQIGLAVLKNPLALKLLGTVDYEARDLGKNLKTITAWINPESRYYSPKVIAAKTGYTIAAGCNLLAIIQGEKRRYIAVCTKAPSRKDRLLDLLHMIDVAERETRERRILYEAEHAIFSHEKLTAHLAKDVWVEYYLSESPSIHTEIIWHKNLSGSIHKGQPVGKLSIYDDAQLLESYDLLASVDIKLGFWGWLKSVMDGATSTSSKGI